MWYIHLVHCSFSKKSLTALSFGTISELKPPCSYSKETRDFPPPFFLLLLPPHNKALQGWTTIAMLLLLFVLLILSTKQKLTSGPRETGCSCFQICEIGTPTAITHWSESPMMGDNFGSQLSTVSSKVTNKHVLLTCGSLFALDLEYCSNSRVPVIWEMIREAGRDFREVIPGQKIRSRASMTSH